jgi:hypothetical protein
MSSTAQCAGLVLDEESFLAFTPLLAACQIYARHTRCTFRAHDFTDLPDISSIGCGIVDTKLQAKHSAAPIVSEYSEHLLSAVAAKSQSSATCDQQLLLDTLDEAHHIVIQASVRNIMRSKCIELSMYPPEHQLLEIRSDDGFCDDVSVSFPEIAQRLYNEEQRKKQNPTTSVVQQRRANTASFILDFAEELGVLPGMPQHYETLLAEFERRMEEWQTFEEILECREGECLQIPGGVEIVSAWYGDPKDSHRRIDVKQHIKAGTLIYATNTNFTDPARFTAKVLQVCYKASYRWMREGIDFLHEKGILATFGDPSVGQLVMDAAAKQIENQGRTLKCLAEMGFVESIDVVKHPSSVNPGEQYEFKRNSHGIYPAECVDGHTVTVLQSNSGFPPVQVEWPDGFKQWVTYHDLTYTAQAEEVQFQDTDGDWIRLVIEDGKICEYVNGTIAIRGVTIFDIDHDRRTYKDDTGSGTFQPKEDLTEIGQRIGRLFSKAKEEGCTEGFVYRMVRRGTEERGADNPGISSYEFGDFTRGFVASVRGRVRLRT